MAYSLNMPKLGLTMTEGTVVMWLVKPGQVVHKGDPLLEIMTDKINNQVESPVDGTLQKILVEQGATVPVFEPLALIALEGEAAEEAPAAAPAAASGAAAGAGGREERVKVSPVARKLAEEAGIDLSTVQGTGPGGRIVREDVEAAIAQAKQSPAAAAQAVAAASAPVAAPAPVAVPVGGADTMIPLSGMRKAVGMRMLSSHNSAPHVTLGTEVDVTDLVAWRAALTADLERRRGQKISFGDLILKAVAMALRDHPNINASWTEQGILRHSEVNIGLAVALEEGLIVPVVRLADTKSVGQIARETADLAARARQGALAPAEVTGGTFTISNLGMYGVDYFTPIINPPETAILGVGRIVAKPAIHGDQICKRSLMWLSLSFDHRVVDGAPAAQFLQRITQLLEQPQLLLV